MPEIPVSREQKIVIAIVGLAAFMATLDTSIVNISLPTIAAWFGTGMGPVSWVVMSYLLVLSGLMLACGRLGDLKGFRRVFIAGFVIFTAGSLFCSLSTTLSLLVASRVVQGIGAAALDAMAPAMLVASLPAEKRGWALGVLMTIVSVAIAAGPILGGFITEFLGWHWIFLINVPVGIVSCILAVRYLPQDKVTDTAGRFDTAGAVLILAALAMLLFPLSQGLYLGWTSPVITGSLAACLILFTLFLLHERRCPCPLIDPALFSSHNFLWGNIAGMLIVMVFAGSEFLLPFALELMRGLPTEQVGMLLAIPAVVILLAGLIGGTLSDRYGSRGLMIVSAFLSAATMLLLSYLHPETSLAGIAGVLALEGLAVGLFMPPNMSLVLGSGRQDTGGVASGVMMTLRNVGAMMGVALMGSIAVQGFGGAGAGLQLQGIEPARLVPGFHTAFLAGMIICLVIAGISAYVREERRGNPGG